VHCAIEEREALFVQRGLVPLDAVRYANFPPEVEVHFVPQTFSMAQPPVPK
jgi:hypothetical protein